MATSSSIKSCIKIMDFFGQKKLIEKIKTDITQYLYRKDKQPAAVSKPPSASYSVHPSTMISQKDKRTVYPGMQLFLNKVDNKATNIVVRLSGKKQLQIQYQRDRLKNKISIIYENITKASFNSLPEKCELDLQVKKLSSEGVINIDSRTNYNLVIVFSKEVQKATPTKKSLYDKLLEQGMVFFKEQAVADQNPENDDERLKFHKLSSQQMNRLQKFKKELAKYKDQDKIQTMVQIFRVRPDFQTLKCPVHSCSKSYKDVLQLKNHMKRHSQLSKFMTLNENGTWQVQSQAIDFTMCFARMYPQNTKKLIKQIKTKQ